MTYPESSRGANMAIRHASWRVFLPAILLFTLAIVPPLASLSLWLCGVIRDEIGLNFEIRCALSRESCIMLGFPALQAGYSPSSFLRTPQIHSF